MSKLAESREARESRAAWGLVEQQSQERSLSQSQQESTRQPEQQQRVSGGSLALLEYFAALELISEALPEF